MGTQYSRGHPVHTGHTIYCGPPQGQSFFLAGTGNPIAIAGIIVAASKSLWSDAAVPIISIASSSMSAPASRSSSCSEPLLYGEVRLSARWGFLLRWLHCTSRAARELIPGPGGARFLRAVAPALAQAPPRGKCGFRPRTRGWRSQPQT